MTEPAGIDLTNCDREPIQAFATMALVIHELVTSSTKYGSLSVPGGSVALSWSCSERGDLELQWRDVGGPPVAPQSREGFGTTITERSVTYDLGGEAAVRYVDAALDLIAAAPPSVAVLDVNLGSADSFPIADRLRELAVPFMFATGYGEQAQFPDHHRGRPVVQKPYTIENVARAMAEMVGSETVG